MRNARCSCSTIQTQTETDFHDGHQDMTLQTLASLRMFPEISPIADPINIANVSGTDVESASDDGSDYGTGNTYLPLDDSDHSHNNNYDPTYMEEDGTCDDFLTSITYNYGELTEQLSTPVNMYNGRGPCLRHGVARRFDTVMGCLEVCSGMDYEFFKCITANSNEYARMHMNMMVNMLLVTGQMSQSKKW